VKFVGEKYDIKESHGVVDNIGCLCNRTSLW